jgi:hypothetical protein
VTYDRPTISGKVRFTATDSDIQWRCAHQAAINMRQVLVNGVELI